MPPDHHLTLSTSIVVTRKEREFRPHFLQQTEGEGAPRRILLEKPELMIGREEGLDIHLPSKRASRQHAVLLRKHQDYIILDNDTPNGVFLNGLKIHSAILRDGDVLQVADAVFMYYEG